MEKPLPDQDRRVWLLGKPPGLLDIGEVEMEPESEESRGGDREEILDAFSVLQALATQLDNSEQKEYKAYDIWYRKPTRLHLPGRSQGNPPV